MPYVLSILRCRRGTLLSDVSTLLRPRARCTLQHCFLLPPHQDGGPSVRIGSGRFRPCPRRRSRLPQSRRASHGTAQGPAQGTSWRRRNERERERERETETETEFPLHESHDVIILASHHPIPPNTHALCHPKNSRSSLGLFSSSLQHLCQLKVNPEKKDIDGFEMSDFELVEYKCGKTIKMKMAV